MKPRGRRGRTIVIATGLLSGCGSSGTPEMRQALVEPEPIDPARQLAHLLAGDTVDQHKFFRGVLYSWTTSEQINALRSSPRLLTRAESPTSGAAYVDQILYTLATERRDPLAMQLYTESFAAKRFAWPAAWATRAAWPNESYGDQLIRITLRDDAWIAKLSAATGDFVIHDRDDAIVPLDRVLASPQRIAAIYFVSDASIRTPKGWPRAIASYREYVVCNEAMIASWEIGTARVADEAARSAALIDAVARWIEADEIEVTPFTRKVPEAWLGNGAGPIAQYQVGLALDSIHYELTVPRMRALANQLRDTPKPPAIERVPSVAFVPGPARKPPRIVTRGDITYARAATSTSAHTLPSPWP